jgi:hypothetical protein
MYLAGNPRPDILYAAHHAACFNQNPKKTMEMEFKPNEHFKVGCYVDADFSGQF